MLILKFILLFIVISSWSCRVLANTDDWIGLEPEPSLTLGYIYSHDQADNSTRSIYLSKQLTEAATINIDLSKDRLQNRFDTFQSYSVYGQLDWLFENQLNLAASYQFQGQKAELEVRQYSVQLGYSPYPAFMSIEFMSGNVEIFTREVIPRIIDIADRLASDFNATTYHIGWWFDLFSLSVRHQIFDYKRDISVLSSRPLLQLLIKPAALVQSGLLLSDRTTLSIDYPLEKRRLTGHIMQTRSAISNLITRSVQLDWSESINNSTSLILSINRSDEQQDNWFFSIGLEWSA